MIRWWCEKSGNPKIDEPWGHQTLGNQQLGLLFGTASWEAVQSLFISFCRGPFENNQNQFLGESGEKNPFALQNNCWNLIWRFEKHRGAKGSKFKIHRGITHPKVHQSQKIICRKISNRLINDLQESENKVFLPPWRLPPPNLPCCHPPFRQPDQYSGYSDFTAISEALKSGVTTAFRSFFGQIHRSKGQCSIGNPGC